MKRPNFVFITSDTFVVNVLPVIRCLLISPSEIVPNSFWLLSITRTICDSSLSRFFNASNNVLVNKILHQIIEKNNASNAYIFYGPENIGKKDIKLNDLNILADIEEFKDHVFVKVRSTGKLLKGKVSLKNDNTALVSLEKFEDGISPGQACVFYSKDEVGDKVLGGGWIHKTFNKNLST